MKNADLPAMPNSNLETYPTPCCEEYGKGLTKREMIAMHSIGSLLAACAASGANISAEQAAEGAVKCADALLKELSK